MSDCGACSGAGQDAVPPAAPAAAAAGCGRGGGCGQCTTPLPSRRAPADSGRLSAARRSWCATGAPDDGKMFPDTQAIPAPPSVGATLCLTPYGAHVTGDGGTDVLRVFELLDADLRRRRDGPTGRLVADPACALRPAGTGVLRPGGGSVFVGLRGKAARRMPTAAEWKALPRTVQIAARAQGFHPDAEAPPPCSPGPAGQSSGTGPGGPIAPWQAPVPFGERADPCECYGTMECALENRVVMDYVGYRLCVPARWFYEHHDNNDWMSQTETFDVLWGGVRELGPGLTTPLSQLLGCWMIDTDHDTHGRTYSMFFHEGNAPAKFLSYTLDLIRRTTREIKDEWSGSTACADFAEYVETVLDGGKGKRVLAGASACTVEFWAVSHSTWLPSVSAAKRCGSSSESEDCAAAKLRNKEPFGGSAFDDWSQVLVESIGGVGARSIWRMNVRSSTSKTPYYNAPDGGGYMGYGVATGSLVELPASRLAFFGFEFDFTMFWARAALQFAIERVDFAALYGAWVFARASLSQLVEEGRLLIHELGHVHMAIGGHCDCGVVPCDCCFDMAAENWKCRVASALGLPNTNSLRCDTTPMVRLGVNPCGGEGASYVSYCWREALCEPSVAAFGAGPCSGPG